MDGELLKRLDGKYGREHSNAGLAVDLDGIIIGRSMGVGGLTSTVENGKGRREKPQSTVVLLEFDKRLQQW
jgi:hypothetical protein